MQAKYLRLQFVGVQISQTQKSIDFTAFVSTNGINYSTKPQGAPILLPADITSFKLTVGKEINAGLYGSLNFQMNKALEACIAKPVTFVAALPTKAKEYNGKYVDQPQYPSATFIISLEEQKPVEKEVKPVEKEVKPVEKEVKPVEKVPSSPVKEVKKEDSYVKEEEIVIEQDNSGAKAVLQDMKTIAEEIGKINAKPVNDLPDVLKHREVTISECSNLDQEISFLEEQKKKHDAIIAELLKANELIEKDHKELMSANDLLKEKVLLNEVKSGDICSRKLLADTTVTKYRAAYNVYVSQLEELKALQENIKLIKAHNEQKKAEVIKSIDGFTIKIKSAKDNLAALDKMADDIKKETEKTNALLVDAEKQKKALNDGNSDIKANLNKLVLEKGKLQNIIIENGLLVDSEKLKNANVKIYADDTLKVMEFKISNEKKLMDQAKKNEEAYNKMIEQLNTQISDAEKEIHLSKEDLNKLWQDMVKGEANDKSATVSNHQNENKEFDKLIQNKQNCDQNGDYADCVADVQEKLTDLTIKCKEVHDKMNEAREKVAKNHNLILSLRNKCDAAKANNQKLVHDAAEIALKCDDVQKDLAAVKEDSKLIDHDILTVQDTIKAKQAIIKAKEEAIKEIEKKIDSVNFRYSEIELDMQKQMEILNKLDADIQDAVSQKKVLDENHKKAMEEKKKERDDLINTLNNLNSEIKALKEENKNKALEIQKKNQEFAELDDKLFSLEVEAGKEIYKPVPKDQIDEKLAEFLRRHRCPITFKRLDKGYYQFGSMKLQATIQKSRLVFNVSHTYIPVEDLVKNYGESDSGRKATKKDSSPLFKSTIPSTEGTSPSAIFRSSIGKSTVADSSSPTGSPSPSTKLKPALAKIPKKSPSSHASSNSNRKL